MIPITVNKPTITFHPAIIRALGRYLDIKKPGSKTPIALKTSATVPVTKLCQFSFDPFIYLNDYVFRRRRQGTKH